MLLFRLLTGVPPFAGSTPYQLMCQHCSAAPPRPSDVRPGLDPALDEVCLTALKKRPGERYRSAEEFARAMAERLPASAAAPSPPPAATAGAPVPPPVARPPAGRSPPEGAVIGPGSIPDVVATSPAPVARVTVPPPPDPPPIALPRPEARRPSTGRSVRYGAVLWSCAKRLAVPAAYVLGVTLPPILALTSFLARKGNSDTPLLVTFVSAVVHICTPWMYGAWWKVPRPPFYLFTDPPDEWTSNWGRDNVEEHLWIFVVWPVLLFLAWIAVGMVLVRLNPHV